MLYHQQSLVKTLKWYTLACFDFLRLLGEKNEEMREEKMYTFRGNKTGKTGKRATFLAAHIPQRLILP